jgi:hypothetical protein
LSAAGGSGSTCASSEKIDKAFLAGATPTDTAGNAWDELIDAIGNMPGLNNPTSRGVQMDITNLWMGAQNTTDDLSQSQDITGDVAKAGQDYGTTFTPATTSL